MNAIYSREEWQKVRKLSKWGEIIPTWVYIVGAIISFIAVFVDNQRSNIWVWGLVFFVYKWAGRESYEEGYVNGWNMGQDYITGDSNIDDLLKIK